ncbi:hypothetical protein CHS0354_008967 [Potamilus streckersoni]|uniref:Cadherin domain-containing protein n=1 Tax=Potamilus streckersoni TaxID=2493646 RepID=A0AAE0WEE0_9BIVA|nr:hypothetical protein CHS0354_008967 [Potamilus streckersoni]
MSNATVWTNIAMVTATDADQDSIIYDISEGNEDSMFLLNPVSGEIYLMKTLDNERSSYMLLINAIDEGSPSLSGNTTITITVLHVGNTPPLCISSLFSAPVSEVARIGDVVAELNCNDTDSDDVLTYSIVWGNTDMAFSVNSTGAVLVNEALDYESGPQSYSLEIEVSDATSLLTVLVDVYVTMENEHSPEFNASQTVFLAEDTAVGTSLWTYTAADGDLEPYGISSYSIASVTTNETDFFAIDELTGILRLARELQDDDIGPFLLLIVATDGGGLKGTGTVTVSVFQINKYFPSCNPILHVLSVTEDTVVGSVLIDDFNCSDLDGNTSLIYNLSSQFPVDSVFILNDSSGTTTLQLQGPLDYETMATYQIDIVVSDNGKPNKSTYISVVVIVIDISDVELTFTGSFNASIVESASIGTLVAIINASDLDDTGLYDGKIQYSVLSGGDNKFKIDSVTGAVINWDKLDRETVALYELVIQAVEKIHGKSATTTLTVTVLDVNDNSPVCTRKFLKVYVPEDTVIETAVTTLNCSDADEFTTLNYNIRSGYSSIFFVNDTDIVVNSTLDYETGPNEYTLTFEVSDGERNFTAFCLLLITDVNDCMPMFDPDSFNMVETLPENTSLWSVIRTVHASDNDLESVLEYGIANSSTSPFKINPVLGTIYLQKHFDYETATQVFAVITVTDGKYLATTTLTVNVTNVNDNYPKFTQNGFIASVTENYPPQMVLDVNASDLDNKVTVYGQVMYAIADGNEEGFFAADENTGQINSTVYIDYEYKTLYSLTVIAYDSLGGEGSLTSTTVVQISIIGENEFSPVFSQNSYSAVINENAWIDTSVIQVIATDFDAGNDGSLTYSIYESQNEFYIERYTGIIFTNRRFDYESGDSYFELNICAKDSGSNWISACVQVIISIADVNDNTPVCFPVLQTLSYYENETIGHTLPSFSCHDADSGSNSALVYSISSINDNSSSTVPFSIASNTGILTLTSFFDYESANLLFMLVKVEDRGSSPRSTTVTYIIDIVDINKHSPIFQSTPYNLEIPETIPIGYTIFVATATDLDAADSVLYFFYPLHPIFGIDMITGRVQIQVDTLDRKSQSTYNLTLYVADRGLLPLSRTSSTTIFITITNSTAPVFASVSLEASVSENAAAGTTVLAVSASDPDDASFTYSIASGNLGNVFAVNADGTLVVQDTRNLDYETIKNYSLTLEIQDPGGLKDAMNVTINVISYNEFAPVFIHTLTTVIIREDTIKGTIFSIKALDADAGYDGEIIHSIQVDIPGVFSVDALSGDVKLVGTLDMEAITNYTVQITAKDNGIDPGRFSSAYTLPVLVTDVNDNTPTCSTWMWVANISEGVPIGTHVIQLNCSDADHDSPNNLIGYSIVSGISNSEFSVNQWLGKIVTNRALDRESQASYNLMIKVVDYGTPSKSVTTTLSVIITDINDFRPVFSHGDQHIYVAEDETIGTFLIQVNATDNDTGLAGVYFFSIIQGNQLDWFTVDEKTGIISIKRSLDAEIATNITLDVIVFNKDSFFQNDSIQVYVYIANINDNAPLCPTFYRSFHIAENATVGSQVLTLRCTDADGNNLTYSITSGSTNGKFSIDSNTGAITTSASLDAEVKNIYSIKIFVTDGNFSNTNILTISVDDINDNPPVILPAGSFAATLMENVPLSTVVLSLSATDNDITSNNFYYSISAGNEDGKFVIFKTSGKIELQSLLDRETVSEYNLTIEVADGKGFDSLTAACSLIVTVSDYNDNKPVCTENLYLLTLDENVIVPTTIVQLSCYDSDISTPTLLYTPLSIFGSKFFINNVTGEVTLIENLDYENMTEHNLHIIVSDQGNPALQTTVLVRIFVNPINEFPPVFNNGTNSVSVTEDTGQGIVILQVIARDADKGLDHNFVTYSIVSGNSGDHFFIDSSNGLIIVSAPLDRETVALYNLLVMASDMVAGSVDQKSSLTNITITITDVNDNSPVFSLSTYSTSLLESSTPGTTLIRVTATDADEGLSGSAGLQYRVSSGNVDGKFRIIGDQVILDGLVDYQTNSQYHLKIEATDQGSPAFSSFTCVTITVVAVNEYSPVFLIIEQFLSVIESEPIGTSLYKFSASDSDTGHYGEFRFYLAEGNYNSTFYLDENTGELIIWSALDFDTWPSSYNLTVEVRDSGDNSSNTFHDFTWLCINLTDVNDNSPIFVDSNGSPTSNYTLYLNENAVIGYTFSTGVTATDADSGINARIFYSIGSGDGSHFLVNFSTGWLSTNFSGFDYEAKSLYSFLILAKDGGTPSLSSECLVSVVINDINDNKPLFQKADFSVTINEPVAIGIVIATVNATDADSSANNNNKILYSVTSLYFSIDSNSGVIRTADVLDRDTIPSHILTVLAVDQGSPHQTGTATVTVILNDVNDNNPVITGTYDNSIPENTTVNTAVFTIIATDIDAGENSKLSYSITAGNDNYFQIDTTTGVVRVQKSLDYETTDQYLLTVTVLDNGDPQRSDTITVKITVLDSNDNFPVFSPSSYCIDLLESTAIGTTIYQVTATDIDVGLAGTVGLQYSIIDGDVDGVFSMINDYVILHKDVDYMITSQFALKIEAKDQGSNPLSSHTYLKINVIAVNEYSPLFTVSKNSISVYENTSVRTTLFTFTAQDNDTGQYGEVRFYITDGIGDSLFNLDEYSGILSLSSKLDYDTEPREYNLTIQVQDVGDDVNNTLYDHMKFFIILVDVNDNAPIFFSNGVATTSFTLALSEDAGSGYILATAISAMDNDSGINSQIKYSILSGDGTALFSINPLTGVLMTTSSNFDYETKVSYTFYVEASDSGFPSHLTHCTVNILINDLNDNAPVFDPTKFSISLLESSPIGTKVTIVSARDVDSSINNNNVVIYSLSSSHFTIDANSGIIQSVTTLDRETEPSHTLYVIATDQGSPKLSATATVTVNLEDVNDNAPVITGTYDIAIYENTSINTILFTIAASDADEDENAQLIYTVSSGNINNTFKIDLFTGEIAVRSMLDYESVHNYTLEVVVYDTSYPQHSVTVSATITILDVNDNYPIFKPATYSTSILESASIGIKVIRVTATDKDEGIAGTAGLQYTIVGGNSEGVFSMMGDSIYLEKDIDSMMTSQYWLQIRAADQGYNSHIASTYVTVNVIPVNEFAPFFVMGAQTVTISEDTPVGVSLYTAYATDLDTGQYGELLYYITSGNDNLTFLMDANTGELTLLSPLDYDSGLQSYNLTIMVQDKGDNVTNTFSSYTHFMLYVTDVNDMTPTFSSGIYSVCTDENVLVGHTVYTGLSASDADSGQNGQITYSIVSVDGVNIFAINDTTAIVTVNIEGFDYESKQSYSLIVQAMDNGSISLYSWCQLKICIKDVNDNAPVFKTKDRTVSISEASPVGTIVTQVTATDADSSLDNNNVFSYSMASSFFAVNSTTGIITTTAILDREAVPSYILTIFAVDEGSPKLTGTSTLTVYLDDVNDNSPLISGINNVSVYEDIWVNSMIFSVTASDQDYGENGQLSFAIVSGNTDADFKIEESSGFVLVQNVLDRERTESYLLIINVTDHGDIPNSATITASITLLDVNDNTPTFSQMSYYFTVFENITVGSLIGTLSATDNDVGLNAEITFSIINSVSGNSSHFIINSVTGVITTATQVDRETWNLYRFVVQATDAGIPALSGFVNVTVTILDSNDFAPVFSQSLYSVAIAPNLPVGTSLLKVSVSDADEGTNAEIMLSIDTSNMVGILSHQYLNVNSSSSVISVKEILTGQPISNLTFIMKATDGGYPPLSSSAIILIYINDSNDNRPVFISTFYDSEIPYNDYCQKIVTKVSATDADIGVNSQIKYYFTKNDYPTYYKIDSTKGDITLIEAPHPNEVYVFYAGARDSGTPSLEATIPAIVRVDTYDYYTSVVSVTLGINKTTFTPLELAFLDKVTMVLHSKYYKSQAKRWCVEEVSAESCKVYVYTVEDNSISAVGLRSVQKKQFLTSKEILQLLTDSELADLKWEPYKIKSVSALEKVEHTSPSPPWIETTSGIVTVASACVFTVIIVVSFSVILHRCRKMKCQQRSSVERTSRNGPKMNTTSPVSKDHLKGESQKAMPEIKDFDKNHPPPAVVSIPLPRVYPATTQPKSVWEEYIKPEFMTRPTGPRRNSSSQSVSPFPPDVSRNVDIGGDAFDRKPESIGKYNTEVSEIKWLASHDQKSGKKSSSFGSGREAITF